MNVPAERSRRGGAALTVLGVSLVWHATVLVCGALLGFVAGVVLTSCGSGALAGLECVSRGALVGAVVGALVAGVVETRRAQLRWWWSPLSVLIVISSATVFSRLSSGAAIAVLVVAPALAAFTALPERAGQRGEARRRALLAIGIATSAIAATALSFLSIE